MTTIIFLYWQFFLLFGFLLSKVRTTSLAQPASRLPGMDDLLVPRPPPPKESQAISPSDSVTDCPKLSPVDSTDLSPAEAAGIAEQDRKKGNETSDTQTKLSSGTKAQQTSSSAAARESNKPAQAVFEEFRLKGNALVKSGDYKCALHCYSQYIKASPATSIGYTNRALCFLKLNRPSLAENDCTIVLEVDSINVTALYQRALARKALCRYSQAIEDLHELLKIDCKNTAAQSEMDAVKELWRKQLLRMKALEPSQRIALERVALKAEAAMPSNCDLQALIRTKLYNAVPNLTLSLLEQSHGNWDEFMKSVNRIICSVADYMANEAPAIIHLHPKTLRDLLKVGLYQNRFETGRTSGFRSRTARKRWENLASCEAYENAPAKDRPKYGTLNVVNDPRGMKLCVEQYGCIYLKLKNDIRFRMTFSDKDTSSPDVTVVDCDPRHMILLILSLSPEVLKEMLLIVSGEKLAGDSSVIACYPEIQVHGLINLRTDVEEIVLDVPSYKEAKKAPGKKFTGSHSLTKAKKFLRAIEKEYGIPYKLIEPEE